MFVWNGDIIANFEANGTKYPANLNEVSGDAFATLGVQPLLGRLIGPEDVGREADPQAPRGAVALDPTGCESEDPAGQQSQRWRSKKIYPFNSCSGSPA